MPRYLPLIILLDSPCPATAVTRSFGGKQQSPFALLRRRQQRFRRRTQPHVQPKSTQQQSIVATFAKESQDKCFRAEHRPVHSAPRPSRKDRVLAPKLQQVAMKIVNRRIFFPLRKIQLAAAENLFAARMSDKWVSLRARDCLELMKELLAAGRHQS